MPITRRLLIALALLAATLSAQSGLEVIAAYYGTDLSFLDVTAIVRAQAQADGLALTVGSTALGGDPFPGQLKTLRIYYKLSGQFQQGEWKDGENIALGRLNNGSRNTGMRGGGRPGARERPTISAPLTIIQATYGAGTRTVDVTSLLQSRVQRDQLDFEVPGSLLGDPAPGLLKELLVSYQWNGQTREARVRDGERQAVRLRLSAHDGGYVQEAAIRSVVSGDHFEAALRGQRGGEQGQGDQQSSSDGHVRILTQLRLPKGF